MGPIPCPVRTGGGLIQAVVRHERGNDHHFGMWGGRLIIQVVNAVRADIYVIGDSKIPDNHPRYTNTKVEPLWQL